MDVAVDARTVRRLPPQWRRWLAENLMLGTDPAVLAETLEASGESRDLLDGEIRQITSAAAYPAGEWIADRLRKAEALLRVYRDLARLADPPGQVERRTHVGADEFLHTYYGRNRPVVLAGLARPWRAFRSWTPAYLREQCGDEPVEVMSGRDADSRYEVNADVHKKRIRFAEYVDQVVAAGTGNDIYLVANNHFLDVPALRHLTDDLGPLPDLLDPAKPAGSIFLWFGPAGTVTPLHHDTMNVLLVQIVGRKRVILVPSAQLPLVYNDIGVFSEVDAERPDLARHPLFAGADPVEVTLDAGDALFIPVGWWHHVRSLDVSISTSFINFAFPNDYAWQHPRTKR